MQFASLVISHWLLIAILLVWVFGKSLKGLLDRLRVTKVTHGGTTIYLEQSRGIQDVEIKARLRRIGESPPDNFNEIIEDLKSMVLTDKQYEGLTTEAAKLDYLSKKTAQASLNHMLESINSLIFGSQIRILEYLDSSNSGTIEDLRPFYDAAQTQLPNGFGDYSFDKYMGFLENAHLVKAGAQSYSITGLGRAYLAYRFGTGRSGSYPPL